MLKKLSEKDLKSILGGSGNENSGENSQKLVTQRNWDPTKPSVLWGGALFNTETYEYLRRNPTAPRFLSVGRNVYPKDVMNFDTIPRYSMLSRNPK